MTKRATNLPKRKGYHHGNLKEALIEAARALIARHGPNGFTLVEAARRAGVSAAAPYRHFKDRDALIAEVAAKGFALFRAQLGAAWEAAREKPQDAFAEMGAAYLKFAKTEPGFYRAMFSGGEDSGPRSVQGHPAFAMLESAIASVKPPGGAGQGRGPDPKLLAYQVWSLAHGIATLSASDLLPTGEGAPSPERILQIGVTALMLGTRAMAEQAKR